MSPKNEMPDDPQRNPEQAVDALEEKVFGSTADQERDDEADPAAENTDDAGTTPVADEPPA
ncbi:MAG: hypothetical protein ABW212_17490 [Pseudonocardia sediminis]